MAEIDNDQALLDSLEGEFGESEYDLGNDEEEALLAEDDATEDVLDLEVQPEDILESAVGSERCNTSKLDVGSLSDAEESERHSDRFKTERITVVRPSRTIPDSLDQVRTNEDKRSFTNQNKPRNNRFQNAGGHQAKNFQNGQRRNLGEFRQLRTGFRNNQPGGAVTQGVRIRTDVRTVLINPHFKGQVKVKDNSRLAWDNQRRGSNQRVVTESQWTNNNFQYSNNSQPQPQPQVWIVPPHQQQQQPAPFQQIPRPFQPGPAPFQQQPPAPFVNQPPQFNQPQPCFQNQPYPVNNNTFAQPQFPNQQYSLPPPNNFTSTPNNFTSQPNNFAPPPNNYAPLPTNYNPAPNFNNVLPNNFNNAPIPSNFVPPQNNFTAPPRNDFCPSPAYQNYGQPPQQPQQVIQQQPQNLQTRKWEDRHAAAPPKNLAGQRNRSIGESSIKRRLGNNEVQAVKKRPLTSSNNLEVIPTTGNQTAIKKEDVEEDETIKAYRLEIEKQKRKREEFLKLKEARRLEAVKQEQPKPIPVANRIQAPRPSQIQVLTRGPQIRRPLLHNQTNQNSVLRQVTLTNDEDQPPKLSSAFLSSRQVIDKDRELPDTSIVVVSNLATGTTQVKLRKMCQGVGDIQTLQASAKERQATIAFKSVASAHAFYKKYNHTMLDLSMIQVKLLPKTD